jgi:hypothetical protein
MQASERWPALGRWRWRVSGAWQWPLFGALVVGELVMLPALPPWGTHFTAIDAFVVVGALNLIVVGALAPLGGVLLRRVRGDLPRIIAGDRAGSWLLLALFALLLALGIVHHGQVRRASASLRAQSAAVRHYLFAHGSSIDRRELARADTVMLSPGFYRTCIPSTDPTRALCLFIDTSQRPARVTLDPDETPNIH